MINPNSNRTHESFVTKISSMLKLIEDISQKEEEDISYRERKENIEDRGLL